MVTNSSNPSTGEVEAGGLEVHGHPLLCSEFKDAWVLKKEGEEGEEKRRKRKERERLTFVCECKPFSLFSSCSEDLSFYLWAPESLPPALYVLISLLGTANS